MKKASENIIKKNAQEWIEKTYPRLIQKNLKKLDISNQNLAGSLDLNYFTKLEELKCCHNPLTSLILFDCPNLKKLEVDKEVQIFARRSIKELVRGELAKKDESQRRKRQARIIPSHALIWNDIHADFTLELTKVWQDLGFTQEQAHDWIKVGFQPTDYEVCTWLRDVAKKDAEWILNNATHQGVERNFWLWKEKQKQIELQAQIEQLLQIPSKY